MSEEKQKEAVAKLKIEVDNKATEQLVDYLREKDEEKQEDEQQAKPEKSLNDLIVQTANKFGNFEFWKQATSTGMLRDMLTSYINDLANKNKPEGDKAGSAPLNEAQYGRKPETDLYTKPYSSYEEMIKDLREKARNGSKEAESYLNELFKKYYEFKRADSTKGDNLPNPNTPESLLDLHLTEKQTPVGTFTVPNNPSDSELGQLLRKWALEARKRNETGVQQ